MIVKTYESYQSKKFILPCSFLYPSEWRILEMAEQDECHCIYIGGPRNQSKESGLYTAAFKIALSQPLAEASAESAVSSLASSYSKLAGYKVVRKALGKIAGQSASEIEVTYSMLLPLHTVDPQSVIIHERHVLLDLSGQFLELSYSASEQDYTAWLEAFFILVRTFYFLEKSQTMLSSPLVAEAWGDTTEICDERASGEK